MTVQLFLVVIFEETKHKTLY